MNESWLPWLVLAVSGAALHLFRTRSDKPVDVDLKKVGHASGGVAVLVSLIFLGLAFMLKDNNASIFPAGIGLAIGTLMGGALGFLGSRFDPLSTNRLTPVGLGVGMAYLSMLAPIESRSAAAFGVAAGLGLAVWIVGSAPTIWPTLATLGAIGTGFAIAAQESEKDATVASALVVALIVGFCFELVRSGLKKPLPNWVGTIVIGGISALVVWQIGKPMQWTGSAEQILAVAIAFGTIATLAAEWMDDQPLIGVLLGAGGIALGSSGFMWNGESGLIWTLIGFSIIPALRGSKMAVASTSALTAIGFLYMMKWFGFEGRITFELGRHYMLTGLLLGATIPLLMSEWQRDLNPKNGMKNIGAIVLMLLAFVAACYGVRTQLSQDTVFGLLIGFCLSGALSLFGKLDAQRVTALGTAMAFFVLLLSNPKDAAMLEFSRDERLRMVLILSIVIFVCVLGAVQLAGKRRQEATGSDTLQLSS